MASPRTAGTECGPTEKNKNLLKEIPFETFEENFERNLVFLKGLRDGLLEDGTLDQLDLTLLELPGDERDAFLLELKTAFESEAIKGDTNVMLRDYFHSQLDQSRVDKLMNIFNNEGYLIQSHNCMKKGNPFLTVLARLLGFLRHDKRRQGYAFDAGKYQCHGITHEMSVRSQTIRDLCIGLVKKGTAMTPVKMTIVRKPNERNYEQNKKYNMKRITQSKDGDFISEEITDIVDTYTTIFIELKEFDYSSNYISFKSQGFFETNFVRDSIINNPTNIFNLHPKLAYLFYKFENGIWACYFFEGRHVCPQIPANMDISRFITTDKKQGFFRTTFKKNKPTKPSVDLEQLNNAVTAMYYGTCFRISLRLPDPYIFYSMNFREKVDVIVRTEFSDEDIAYIEEMSLWTGYPLTFSKFKTIIVSLISISGGKRKTRNTRKARNTRRNAKKGTRSR
jgi:hypothetical protein